MVNQASTAARIMAVTAHDSQFERAQTWAATHGFSFMASLDACRSHSRFEFALAFNAAGIELVWLQYKAPTPLRVEFVGGALGHRLNTAIVRQELLARAVGMHKAGSMLRILDATAGLGRDGMLLAMLGCDVMLREQAVWMALLLEDGVQRALSDANFSARLRGQIALSVGDSRAVMKLDRFDVIYLDPMFPHSGQSALPAKAMQALQHLLGESAHATDDLLDHALASTPERVVVKRPKHGPPLGGREPSYSVTGRACRFDVYQRLG